MNNEDSRIIAQSCEKFSIDAYKNTASKVQNSFVFSPIGAHLVLSMAAYGADGNTRLQMMKGLRLPDDDSICLRGFKALLTDLKSVLRDDLSIASKIFFSHKFNVKSEYVSAMTNYFSATVDLINFSKTAESGNIINGWFSESTKTHVEQIIDEGDLDHESGVVIVLVNKIYLKPKWKYVFHPMNTECGPFYLNETETIDLDFMYQRPFLFYGELEDIDAKFVELPYENESSRMIVIVPNKITGLSEVEQNLDKINMERLVTSGTVEQVKVFLPKFKIESDINLKECLIKIGMTDMFTNKANFRKIIDEVGLKTSKVVQKAFIEIDENGTTASAETVMVIKKKKKKALNPEPPKIIRADRPFMMIIMCNETPLFYAKFTG